MAFRISLEVMSACRLAQGLLGIGLGCAFQVMEDLQSEGVVGGQP